MRPPGSPPGLLVRDREELDRAARLLAEEDPAFVVLVCPEALRPAALKVLRERVPGLTSPLRVEEPEQALVLVLGPHTGVLSIEPAGDGALAVFTTLNWHREKLRRPGSRTLLWLDGAEAFGQFRQSAPDAWSFRDGAALVQGDGGAPARPAEGEPEAVRTARARAARAPGGLGRAAALAELAEKLRVSGRLAEAESAATEALAAIPERVSPVEEARMIRSKAFGDLKSVAAEQGQRARSRRLGEQALEALGALDSPALRARSWAIAGRLSGPPPYRRDLPAARRAAREIEQAASFPGEIARLETGRGLARCALDRVDLRAARTWLRGIPTSAHPYNTALVQRDLARLEESAGRLVQAQAACRAAAARLAEAGSRYGAWATLLLAGTFVLMGELEAADRLAAETDATDDPLVAHARRLLLARLATARGDVGGAIAAIEDARRAAADAASDALHYEACARLAQVLVSAHDAGRLAPADLGAWDRTLADAEDLALVLVPGDPPWYRILFPSLRAELLATRDDRLAEAVALERAALDLARSGCPELAPERGRRLAGYLLRAGRAADALALLDEVLAEAEREEDLGERARALCERLLALTALDRSSADAMDALKAALLATDSPRHEAEVLLDLARRLPAARAEPDAHALALHAHRLFLEMPMPESAARALEVAGDVLTARGRAAEARRRYRAAAGLLEAHGLGLRLAGVRAKA